MWNLGRWILRARAGGLAARGTRHRRISWASPKGPQALKLTDEVTSAFEALDRRRHHSSLITEVMR